MPKNIKVQIKKKNIKVNLIGRRGIQGIRGPQGDPATNIITSVNEQIGAVQLNADNIPYDNSDSGASSNDVQTAIDEAFDNLADTGANLSTKVDKTTTVNGHPLSSNVVVTPGDVGNTTAQWNASEINGIPVINTGSIGMDDVLQYDADADVFQPGSLPTKSSLGLGNVENTSDLDKPVSTDTQDALDLKEDKSNKNIANGYAGLDNDGLIFSNQLPSISLTDTFVVSSQSAMLALNAQKGDVAIRTDLNKSFILIANPATTLSNWQELLTPTDAVLSVNGRTGSVTGLAEDNSVIHISGNETVTGIKTFTFSPLVPTPSNNTDVANKLYVDTTVAAVPIGNYLLKAGDTMTGTLGTQSLNPTTDNMYNLGTTRYYNQARISRLYVNTTAYFDGSTAGVATLTGALNAPTGYVMAGGSYSATPTVPGVYLGVPSGLNPRFTIAPTSGDVRAIDNATGTIRFIDSTLGTVQFMSDANGLFTFGNGNTPSHTVTLPSSATGIVLYNTSNQTTDYERMRMFWSGNLFSFVGEIAGTGSFRDAQFGITSSLNTRYSAGNTKILNQIGATGVAGNNLVNYVGTLAATAGVQQLFGISPTYTQSGTAGSTDIIVNRIETSLGSGSHKFIDLQVSGASKFVISNTGNVGIQSGVATHSITLGSTSTGLVAYNTSDQTTNYERWHGFWSGNIYMMTGEFGGTGAQRAVRISSQGSGYIQINSGSTNGYIQSVLSSASGGSIVQSVEGAMSASSGIQYGLRIFPTINQSITAGYTAMFISVTETATGSSAKNLIDAQVGGVSKFKVDNTGKVTAPNITSTYVSSTAPANPVIGDIWVVI